MAPGHKVPPVYAVDYIQSPRTLHHHNLTCIHLCGGAHITRNNSTINQLAGRRHIHYDKDEGVVSETFSAAVNNLKIIKTGKKNWSDN
jgi:hypothetical protein